MGFEAQLSYRLPSPPLRVFRGVEFGDGRDVCLELLGKDGGELLRGCVGFIQDGRCGVRVSIIRNDVPRRHPLEIHEVMRRGYGESPQHTKAEGALGVLGNPPPRVLDTRSWRSAPVQQTPSVPP